MTGTAQTGVPADSTLLPDWNPSFLRAGVDISRLLGSAIRDFRNSMEVYAEFDTHQFFVVGEFGIESNHRSENYFNYENSGRYWRLGAEYNLTPWSTGHNVTAIGIRYARSTFSDQLTFNRDSTAFGAQSFDLKNENISAQWIEFTGAMKVRVWSQLYLGAVVRVKTFKRLDGVGDLLPYDIPGFGRNRKSGTADKTSTVGISYYLSWTIRWRDKMIPPRPKI